MITGCGSGFGQGLAIKCAEHGMTVFAGCLTDEHTLELKKKCEGLTGRLHSFVIDVTSDESVRTAKEFVSAQLQKEGKTLHALVNNAGIPSPLMYDDMLDLNEYKKAIEVNTFGVIRTTHAFKQLIKQARGRIITCTSCFVHLAPPGNGPYTVAKRASAAFMDVLRYELRDFGVIVSVVEPGVFKTPFTKTEEVADRMDGLWANANEDIRREYGEEAYTAGKKIALKMCADAPSDITPVVNAYFHAITALYPRRRYVVGFDANYPFRIHSYLCPTLQEVTFDLFKWLVGAPKLAVHCQKVRR